MISKMEKCRTRKELEAIKIDYIKRNYMFPRISVLAQVTLKTFIILSECSSILSVRSFHTHIAILSTNCSPQTKSVQGLRFFMHIKKYLEKSVLAATSNRMLMMPPSLCSYFIPITVRPRMIEPVFKILNCLLW